MRSWSASALRVSLTALCLAGDNVYEMATDTHVVREGKIVAQSFAGQIKSKR
jgi:hypothetical protein